MFLSTVHAHCLVVKGLDSNYLLESVAAFFNLDFGRKQKQQT